MIVAEDLSVTYPNGVAALKAINFSVARGEFLVLLGPSGAGKSTLLRCLNGLVRPTAGTVSAADIGPLLDIPGALRRHRTKTGMIFQQHHLIGRHTALQNTLMGRFARYNTIRSFFPLPRSDRIASLRALERVGLLDKALTRADQLSGGQQQRVGIARAMVQEPSLVLADEPVASLDPASATQVLGNLHRICREDGITAIVSLHQVGLARKFADRLIGLSGGTNIFEGSAAELHDSIIERIYQNGQSSTRLAAE